MNIVAGTIFELRADTGMINLPPVGTKFVAFEAPNANGWFGANTADGNEWHLHTELVGTIHN